MSMGVAGRGGREPSRAGSSAATPCSTLSAFVGVTSGVGRGVTIGDGRAEGSAEGRTEGGLEGSEEGGGEDVMGEKPEEAADSRGAPSVLEAAPKLTPRPGVLGWEALRPSSCKALRTSSASTHFLYLEVVG